MIKTRATGPGLLIAGLMVLLATACEDSAPTGPGEDGDGEPMTGLVEVRTVTNGSSLDADGYVVMIDGEESESIEISETAVLIERFEAGDHEVELAGLASNCDVTSPTPRTVAVVADQAVSTGFEVECAFVRRDLAFTSDRDGNSEIYAMQGDGSRLVRLTDHPAHDTDPAGSPGGSLITFATDRFGGGLGVMDAGGSNAAALTDGDYDLEAAWSPDGTKIAFTRDESGGFGDPDVYMINADGSNPRNFTQDADGSDPAWSPDGSRIAFDSDRDGNPEVYTMGAGGSGLLPLTHHPAIDTDPAWSPDGTRIAFATDRDGNFEVYVMDADGSNPVNLTDHPAHDFSPEWSPDGTRLAFVTNRDGNLEVYIMDGDGADPVNLTREPSADDRGPAWLR